jgi:hypothetical protein
MDDGASSEERGVVSRIGRLPAAALLAVVGGLLLLGQATLAAAQSQAEVARLLRIEWEAAPDTFGPPRLGGYIYNASAYRIGSVRLRVETLDAAGRVLDEALAWVHVTVPARGHAQFSLRRPRGGATIRLGIESFVLIALEETPETP